VRILLTGVTGQVGHELQRSLAPLGDIVAADRRALDLASPDSIAFAVRALRPGLIVNCAAYTAVDRAESEPDAAMAANATAPGVLAEEAKRLGAGLIHFSTDYVFDGEKGAPYVESDQPAPLSAYGRTKLAGERAVAAAGGPHWIVRTQWLYGLRGKNFVDTMLRLAGEREFLAVVDDQVGSPTSTHDLAPVLWRVLQRRPPPGLYHATNAGSCSWHDFAAEIFRQAGIKLDLRRTDSRSLARPAPRPGRSVLSNAKLVAALGVGLPRWEDALARYLARRSTEVAR